MKLYLIIGMSFFMHFLLLVDWHHQSSKFIQISDKSFIFKEKKTHFLSEGLSRREPTENEEEMVRWVVSQQAVRLTAIYRKELKKNKSLHGRLSTKFTIGYDGKVEELSFDTTRIEMPQVMLKDIYSILKAMVFLPPKDHEIAVTYPLDFEM